MLLLRPALSGLLLLAGTSLGFGQTVPAPTDAAPVPDKLQLRVGLNAARAFRGSSYEGLLGRLPLSAGVEYALSPKFTVYGQIDADLGMPYRTAYNGIPRPLLPTGALGLGARYYYNQAGRARHGRAHGAFVGNYLALEAHTEMRRHHHNGYGNPDYRLVTEYAPSLNLLWGMQRRLNRSLLFDFNAGVGLSPKRSDTHFGGYSSGALNTSTHINLGLYFGR